MPWLCIPLSKRPHEMIVFSEGIISDHFSCWPAPMTRHRPHGGKTTKGKEGGRQGLGISAQADVNYPYDLHSGDCDGAIDRCATGQFLSETDVRGGKWVGTESEISLIRL